MFGLLALLYWNSLPITSTWEYASTIANLKAQSGNFSHFPDKIPQEARDARFFCDVGGFHGDYTVEVFFELPPEQIETLYQGYVAKGAKFVRPNSAGFFPPGEEVMLPQTTEVTQVPVIYIPDFEYTTFEAFGGVAINRNSHKILYWVFSM